MSDRSQIQRGKIPFVSRHLLSVSLSTLDSIRWFQIITLLNPLTYASEGLRYAMVPPLNGKILPTLSIGWVLLGLGRLSPCSRFWESGRSLAMWSANI